MAKRMNFLILFGTFLLKTGAFLTNKGNTFVYILILKLTKTYR